MIITVTPQQLLTALAKAPDPGHVLLENETSSLLLEDNVSLMLMEFMQSWFQNISADYNAPDWIELYSAKWVRKGDPLYVTIQMGLNYTSSQMDDLFAAAVKVPR